MSALGDMVFYWSQPEGQESPVANPAHFLGPSPAYEGQDTLFVMWAPLGGPPGSTRIDAPLAQTATVGSYTLSSS